MKKTFPVKLVSIIITLFMVASLAACGGNANNSTESTTAVTTGNTQATSQAATTEKAADPLGKYEPAIDLTAAGLIASDYKYLEGETFEENAFTKVYRDELGINLKYKWYTDSTQYDQKLSLGIASNDLPDVFRIMNPNDLSTLRANDQLADLTEAYEKYASKPLREVLEFDQKAFGLLHYNGKLVATGMPNNIYEGINQLYIRQDWLDNLGLSAPKTMVDVLKIAEAFTKNDPDKNGKNDTYGISVYKDIMGGGLGDFTGIFNAYHAYPKIWVKDSSGKLVYGSTLPEMKTALAVMQDMYKKGLIDKEFGMMDGAKAVEAITSGKVGMEYGAWWNAAWPLADNMTKDKKAYWRPYPIVSADSNPVLGSTNGGFSSYFVVNKNCKNPEALIKLHNWYLMTLQPENVLKYQDIFQGPEGNKRQSEGQGLAFGQLNYVDKGYRDSVAMSDAISKKDPSSLTTDLKLNYDKALKWLDSKDISDPQNYVQYICFGAGDISAQYGVLGGYMKNKSFMVNEFVGSPTPTMVEKKAVLDKMEIETITNIIMGNPVESYDKFVGDWKKLGGEDITKEVNDWYSSQK
jgi:ABC-type sugar transport system, periplasmic component